MAVEKKSLNFFRNQKQKQIQNMIQVLFRYKMKKKILFKLKIEEKLKIQEEILLC